MDRILNQSHSKQTFLYAFSRFFERTSYYGLRSLLILYMVDESIQMAREEAIYLYGLFTFSIIFSQILGGVLGDLVIGNRRSMILGAVTQAAGAFCLCLPSVIGLYVGMFLIVIGGGFYTPNMIANFGKLYLNKVKLLDSGFAILYLVVNFGALVGILLIGYYGEKFGWIIGFIIAGVVMLLSVIFSLLVKEPDSEQQLSIKQAIDVRVVKILVAFFTVALFWSIYEISGIRFHFVKMKLIELSDFTISKNLWSSISSFFVIPFGVIMVVFWMYFYNNRFIKLTVGFLFAVVSFGILLLIPVIPSQNHLFIYLISLIFLSISEVYISPIIHSMVIQYTNPKYFAIVISLAFIPIRFFSYIIGLFNDELYNNPLFSLKLAMGIACLVSMGLISYILVAKKFVKY